MRMMRAKRFWLGLAWAVGCACSSAAVQAQAAASLPVVARVETAGIEPTPLLAALASELDVPVELVASASAAQAHLAIEGERIERLRVAFVRADGSSVERTLDLSSMRSQASEALALLAANLMRDEASELLAGLRPPERPRPPPPPAAPPEPRGCDARALQRRTFGADLVPYVGTTGRDAANIERRISLNLIGGLTGAVRGIELSGIFSLDRQATCGIQLSGVINMTGGPTQGVQLAEVNWTSGRLDGVQLGMVSIAGSDILGAQLGLVNVGAGQLEGAQLGLLNLAAKRVHGVQVGLANLDAGPLDGGAQLGLVNIARADVRGYQHGLFNLSAGDTRGAQFGLVNVTSGVVHGAQLGLVNIAEDADAAVGLVSVMYRGRTHLDVWGTDAGLAMVGIRHGSRLVHNIYGVGATARDERLVLAGSLGIGVSWLQRGPVFLDLDAIGYFLSTQKQGSSSAIQTASILQLRAPIGIQLTTGIALFLSPAINVSIAEGADNPLADPSLLPSSRPTKADAKLSVHVWPGFSAGLRFF
jgi:hypothetical protein